MKWVSVTALVASAALWTGTAMAQRCPGDLNGDGQVKVDELITSVNSALTGCPAPGPRFIDNGDGTITDTTTGLMWEKKSDDGSIHDRHNEYVWSGDETWAPDGTVFTVFVATLNDQTFGGYGDWRLPTVEELLSIVDYSRHTPAMDPVFDQNCVPGCSVTECSCASSESFYYMSSSTLAFDTYGAWGVDFLQGNLATTGKDESRNVRGVRGGS